MSDTTKSILDEFIEGIRPPEEIRPKLDIGYTYQDACVEIFEIRPDWRDNTIIRHHPFAKIRYVKSRGVWRLFWLRASGKWEAYSLFPESTDLWAILNCIDEDENGCFKG